MGVRRLKMYGRGKEGRSVTTMDLMRMILCKGWEVLVHHFVMLLGSRSIMEPIWLRNDGSFHEVC